MHLQHALSQAIVDQEFLPVNGANEARRAVRTNEFIGADFIKVVVDDLPRLLNLEEMKAIVEEAHRAKMKVAAHATSREGIRRRRPFLEADVAEMNRYLYTVLGEGVLARKFCSGHWRIRISHWNACQEESVESDTGPPTVGPELVWSFATLRE